MDKENSTALNANASNLVSGRPKRDPLEARVLRAAALRGQAVIQDALGRDPSFVSRVLSNQRGLILAELEQFLEALGLRVVAADGEGLITLGRDEYLALKTLALKALQKGEGECE